MAAKLSFARARAAPPAPAVVALLLAMTCLLLAATAANASRPLKVSSSSSDQGDGPEHTEVVESPAVGYIQTVLVTDDGAAGHRSMSVDMLGGIKNSGPSPGDGH